MKMDKHTHQAPLPHIKTLAGRTALMTPVLTAAVVVVPFLFAMVTLLDSWWGQPAAHAAQPPENAQSRPGGLEVEFWPGVWGKSSQRVGYGRINLYNPLAHQVEARVSLQNPKATNSTTGGAPAGASDSNTTVGAETTYQISLPPGSRRSLIVYHGPATGGQQEGQSVTGWVTVGDGGGGRDGADPEQGGATSARWPLTPKEPTLTQEPPPWAEVALVVVEDVTRFSTRQLAGLLPDGADGRPLKLIPIERNGLPWRWAPLRGVAAVVVMADQVGPMGLVHMSTSASSVTPATKPASNLTPYPGNSSTPEGQAVLQYVAAGGTLVLLGDSARPIEAEGEPAELPITDAPYGLGLIKSLPLANTARHQGVEASGNHLPPGTQLNKYPVAPRLSGMLTTMTIPPMSGRFPLGALAAGMVVMAVGLIMLSYGGRSRWMAGSGMVVVTVLVPLLVVLVTRGSQDSPPVLEHVESADYVCSGPQGLFYYSEAGFIAPASGRLQLPLAHAGGAGAAEARPWEPNSRHSLSVTSLDGVMRGKPEHSLLLEGFDYSGEAGELVRYDGGRQAGAAQFGDTIWVQAGWGDMIKLKVEGFASTADQLPLWLVREGRDAVAGGQNGEVLPCSR